MFEQRILWVVWELRDLSFAVRDAAGRPFVRGNVLPGFIEALLAFRHGPRGMTLVEECLAPFDHLVVDLPDNVGAERVIAPVREREPPAQGGFVAVHDAPDPLYQIRNGQDGLEPSRQSLDHAE